MAERPPYLGLRFYRLNRQTETHIGLYNATEGGFDTDGGPWVTVCEEHASVVNHRTQRDARDWMSAPAGWCEPCREVARGRR